MKYLRNPGFGTYAILFLVFFAGTYFYFQDAQTRTIYGDDLYLYKVQEHNRGLARIINVHSDALKFRPVSSVVSYAEVCLFKKELFDYFVFNVLIQAMIAVVFAAIANIFLRSFLLSALAGLLVGWSRFDYYNITQIMCGGPLEGLAMLFFLFVLYHLARYFADENSDGRRQFHHLIWALVFAELSIYSHERYVVLFPLILFFCLVHPVKNYLSAKQKGIICTVAALSIFANYAIKTYIYKYPFLTGTGVTSLTHEFQWNRQLGFLADALLCIVQLNYGPGYQVGTEFYDSTDLHKALMAFTFLLFVATTSWFVISGLRMKDKNGSRKNSSILLCLLLLFAATLAPGVSTINIELRWMQAALAVFLLMFIVIASGITTKRTGIRIAICTLFLLVFGVSDYCYMITMSRTFWMKGSEWQAGCYKQAMASGTIPKNATTVYYLSDKTTEFIVGSTAWLLDKGYFFDFYGQGSKKILFMDSTRYSDGSQLSYLKSFDTNTQVVIKFTNVVANCTNEILNDRDKYFMEHGIAAKDSR